MENDVFIVAPTDVNWYEFQKRNGFADYINFWTPSDWRFKALKPGGKLVFKLKGPGDYVGGYGSFVEYKYQTLEMTWNEFGRRNGIEDKDTFIAAIGGYKKYSKYQEPKCGCIVLYDVVYFDSPLKLSDYSIDFDLHTVKFKTYNTAFPFERIEYRQDDFSLVDQTKKKKKVQSVTDREGQGEFRAEISRAYCHKCCISGESMPELLQAAHIQDYINKESNHVQNGLLLRIDLHKLFDNGLLYIDDEYKVHISPLIKSEDYRKFEGQRIALPDQESCWPSLTALLNKAKSFRC